MALAAVGLVALFFVVAGLASSGIGGGLAFIGVFAVLIAVGALITGRAQWAFIRTRKVAGALTAVGLLALAVGGAMIPTPAMSPSPSHLTDTGTTRPAPSSSTSAAPTTTAPTSPAALSTSAAPVPAIAVPSTSTPAPIATKAAPATTTTTKTAPRPAPAPPPQPAPAPAPAPEPAPARAVTPGAFCSPEGATGYTVKGTPMVCSTKPGDVRARWRSA
ncbi:hypothetical protein [Modestobacter sp. DSM 44400]|uniref:hypothetical protein n=1 Tax=Modestobacter sp. DSM 44400 TaxID=1550230 RepID=UPI000B813C25|nr:hypothetical protein [Modestobacter sp. DSM 44400]